MPAKPPDRRIPGLPHWSDVWHAGHDGQTRALCCMTSP